MINKSAGTIAANFVYAFLGHNHRGIFDCGDCWIIYGNDGYAVDERAKEEVRLLRERLKKLDLKETGFGTNDVSDEGYSWALLIQNYTGLDAQNELMQALKDSFMAAFGAKYEK